LKIARASARSAGEACGSASCAAKVAAKMQTAMKGTAQQAAIDLCMEGFYDVERGARH
jgi:hypothetical protein